jgi:hypothetical protein
MQPLDRKAPLILLILIVRKVNPTYQNPALHLYNHFILY